MRTVPTATLRLGRSPRNSTAMETPNSGEVPMMAAVRATPTRSKAFISMMNPKAG